MVSHRFLIVSYPGQGQINPTLQFSKRLIAMGAHVTIVTTLHMLRRMTTKTTIPGLSYAAFSDGFDDGFKVDGVTTFNLYTPELKRRGSEFITNLILSAENEGHPFTCLIHTLLVPWAPQVAREFNLPMAKLWIEPATVMSILYNYFLGGGYSAKKINIESSCSIELPGLPFSLSPRDMPSYLISKGSYALPLFKEDFEELRGEANATILVNTFEALEPEALRAVDKLNMIPIGPLIPSAFLDRKDSSHDTSFGGDTIQASSNDYIEWLDSKPPSSVVYVSFGSYIVLSKTQMEEIALALLDCGHPFLWVIREKEKFQDGEKEKEEELGNIEELEEVGKIVKWCSQVEVLSHRSMGCFLTHCGWNSTMESLVSGVPMVAFPQWSDQNTNAKLIEDVWKIGVRVDLQVNEDGIVEGEEIRRGLNVVMGNGEKGEELRRNAEKWKGLAKEAGKEGGFADKNLCAFLDDIRNCLGIAKN